MEEIDKLLSKYSVVDVGTEKLVILALAVQLAMLGAFGLDKLDIKIPILRQLIGFIYLTFVPGILLFKAIKLDKTQTNITEVLLYSVGLSLSIIIFTGALTNFLYPIIGISKPISEILLLLTLCIVVFILCFICWTSNDKSSIHFAVDLKQLLSPFPLLLLLLPFISIFGTYFVNFYDNNSLLLTLLLIVTIAPVVIISHRRFSRELYPLAIFIFAISLLYHWSLISMQLWGNDTQIEYYFFNLVVLNSWWDSTIPRGINAMIGVVLLAPIYSIISGTNLTWVFKIIYPFIFSLVPVGLFKAFQKQASETIAFLSCIFFISTSSFFTLMLNMFRQQIAEFFFVLLVLLLIDKNTHNSWNKKLSLLIFSFSLIVSHYGVAYIFMLSLFIIGVLSLFGKIKQQISKENVAFGTVTKKYTLSLNHEFGQMNITPTFIIFYVVLAFGWYEYISGSSLFSAIVYFGENVRNSILDFFNPELSTAVYVTTMKMPSLSYVILRDLYFITQFFIVIGILDTLFGKNRKEFKIEYLLLSITFLIILLFGLISAFAYAGSMSFERIYHLSLFFLAPFSVLGGIRVGRSLTKLLRRSKIKEQTLIKLLAIFFAIYFLFNSGIVYELTNDDSTYITISKKRITESGTLENKATFYSTYPMEQDLFAAKWLSQNRITKTKLIIYSDYYPIALHAYNLPVWGVLTNTTNTIGNSYIYLRWFNIKYKVIVSSTKMESEKVHLDIESINQFSHIIDTKNKIYTNGGAVIYCR